VESVSTFFSLPFRVSWKTKRKNDTHAVDTSQVFLIICGKGKRWELGNGSL